ncbi:MAG: shikimate kinase [Kiloniellaceae bacterium]|nr:shikimate kinase [Kiloniellaceae bacterium]
MVGSESGVNTAVYLGSFNVATISRRALVVDTSLEAADAGDSALPVPRTIALVGLMGAGKSCIGRLLAGALGLPFVDADKEIEAAAGCSVEDIFTAHGEAAFREGERRVIARLLTQPKIVLATGGGAFMDPATRKLIRKHTTSVWLRADVDLLLRRTARRDNRPLLKRGDPREILGRLISERHPVYAEADVTVDSVDGPPEATLARVVEGLHHFHDNAAADSVRSVAR